MPKIDEQSGQGWTFSGRILARQARRAINIGAEWVAAESHYAEA